MFDLLPSESKLQWPDVQQGQRGRRRAVKYAFLLRAAATPGFWHEVQWYTHYMSAFQTRRRCRDEYSALFPDVPEGRSWEFKICQRHELPGSVERDAEGDPIYGAAGMGAYYVCVRVSPLDVIDLNPDVNNWITCLPHELIAHMQATNAPDEWQYMGWRQTAKLAEGWKDRVTMDYLHILPPRVRSEMISDFDYGYEPAKATDGSPKQLVYVKYNPSAG